MFFSSEIKPRIPFFFNLKSFLWKAGFEFNVSWFRKYDAFFTFHDTVFLTYPENHDTKEGPCFLNQEIKTKFFLVVKLENDFNRCISHFYENSHAFVVLTKILLTVINWSQFFNVILNLCVIENYIVPSHLIWNTDLVWLHSLFVLLFCRWCLSITLETFDEICAVLEIHK